MRAAGEGGAGFWRRAHDRLSIGRPDLTEGVFFATLVVDSALAGTVYAPVVLAFVVVYKASRMINFALEARRAITPSGSACSVRSASASPAWSPSRSS